MMGRKRNKSNYNNPSQIQRQRGNDWYTHYYQYLTSIAYQLYEWKNLPDSVDPRYLEMSLHMFGFVGFFKDPKLGYIATQGACSGTINHYLQPTHFHATSPQYQNTFPLYHYADLKKDGQGVVIWNNDYHFSTIPSLQLFAQELTEAREVTNVNLHAQKTPVLITANDNNHFSLKQIYNQYEGNAPVIFAHESIDPESLKVHKTDAPFVVDKLQDYKQILWNEIMTFLGINNTNTDKKERLITDEVNSNDEQVTASANTWLKARREACDRINELYDLELDVELRYEAVEELQRNVGQIGTTKEGDNVE